jgi:conjugative relaxase-like TrwC/TraI family protein
VIVVRSIGPGVASYYLRGNSRGRWVGRGIAGLGLDGGEVGASPLTRVLQGRHPDDGHYVPEVRPARRRAGWDLVFAAPKSVSLLLASCDDPDSVLAAHRAAVSDVLGLVETRHLAVKRSTATHGRLPVRGAVAAAFEHTTNAATEPHLHTHLLLANLGQVDDGTWWALSASDWWPERRALGALYQMGVRHHLATAGWELDWRLHPDGLGDLVDVPRAALRAASGQSRAVRAIGRIEARRQTLPRDWETQALAAGLQTDSLRRGHPRRDSAGSPPYGREPSSPLDLPDLRRNVEARLAETRSAFAASDVVVALASCSPRGASVANALQWSERFCEQAVPAAPRESGRHQWTSLTAVNADERLESMLIRVAGDGGGDRGRDGVGDRGRVAGDGGGDTIPADAARLLAQGRGVEILESPAGRSSLLAHAGALEVARRSWAASGLDVRVAAASQSAAARWVALSGIPARRRGEHAGIVVVDGADRLSTPQLLVLVAGVERSGGRVVMVEGGTLPRLSEPRSAGLLAARARIGTIDTAGCDEWTRDASPGSGHYAAQELLHAWLEHYCFGKHAVLVGLGIDESIGLALAARNLLVRDGRVDGPCLWAKGLPLQPGDRVVALRSLGPDARRGALGTIRDVDDRHGAALVAWDAQPRPWRAGKAEARLLGYGYAATPSLAARVDAPLLLLGEPEAVPRLRERVLTHACAWLSADVDGLRRANDRAMGRGQERGSRLSRSNSPFL